METIVINSLPIINFPTINPICDSDEPMMLKDATPKGKTGVYTGLGVSNSLFDPSTQGLIIGGGNTLTYTYKDSKGCVNSATTQLIVKPSPYGEVEKDIIICEGFDGILTTKSPDINVTYQWYQNGTMLSKQKQKTLNVTEEGYYQIEVTKDGCSFLSTPKNVDVISFEVIAEEEATILFDESIQLQAEADFNLFDQNYAIKWIDEDNTIVSTTINPIVNPIQTTNYTLVVTDNYGCEATDNVLITVLDQIVIPNGFSPNGDDKNDLWIIKNIEDYPNAIVKVFNRWGDVVFVKYGGYLNDWDGQSLPTATYYYVIDLNSNNLKYTGNVTIVR